jgi:DNA-binding FrmR family transcriptional regulator
MKERTMTALPSAPRDHECRPSTARTATRSARGYASGREDYLLRLRRIEGQVRGVQKMIDEDRWCPDVITQLAAVTRAVQEVAAGLLNDHVRHCVLAAARDSTEEGEDRMDEVAATIRTVIRL